MSLKFVTNGYQGLSVNLIGNSACFHASALAIGPLRSAVAERGGQDLAAYSNLAFRRLGNAAEMQCYFDSFDANNARNLLDAASRVQPVKPNQGRPSQGQWNSVTKTSYFRDLSVHANAPILQIRVG